MRFLIFATIFLAVFALLSYYINKRLIQRLEFKPKTKRALRLFLILNFLGIIGYMLTRYEISVNNTLYFLLSIPIGIIFLLFMTTILYEIFHLLLKVSTNEQRRSFFKKSLDIGAVTFAAGITAKAAYNAKNTQVEQINVFIKNLQKEYTIVQLSDVHIGGLIEQNFIHNMVQTVNQLQPDVVVITGDLIDTDIKHVQAAVDELQHLKSTFGTYFVPGNHEYFHGVRSIMDYLTSLGIKCLENENVYIGNKEEGFYLAGVYDVFGYRVENMQPDINKALKGINNAPTVLLAHQPRFIEEVKNVDLMLSGHTHGGQIMPFNWLVKLAQPYIKGLHQHDKRLQIYVNKGTGFWGPPMRLGASAEISHLTLKKA